MVTASRLCRIVFKWSLVTLLVGFVLAVVVTIWANRLSSNGLLVPTDAADYLLYTVLVAVRGLTAILLVLVTVVAVASGLGTAGLWFIRSISGQSDETATPA